MNIYFAQIKPRLIYGKEHFYKIGRSESGVRDFITQSPKGYFSERESLGFRLEFLV